MNNNTMDKFSLAEKVVVITGAAGLLGRMHSKAVLDAGGIAVLIDVNRSGIISLKRELEINYSSQSILACTADITSEDEMLSVLEKILLKYNRIDGLINNACNNPTMKDGSVYGRFEDLDKDEWLKDMDIGLYGSICCSKVFGGFMAAHGGGVILNIASDLGVIAPNQSLYKVEGVQDHEQPKKPVSYSTVKWGLIGLTKYLSTYWAEKNIRVNALALGGVFNEQNEIFLSRVYELIPLRRLAQKDEYMGSIVYMMSDASSYMTGAVVSIDGGRTAW